MPTILNPNLLRFQWAMLLLIYMVTPTIWADPASFTIYVNEGGPPYTVYLRASNHLAIKRLQWSDSKGHALVQDITTSTVFADAGTYTITLKVWDAAGNSDTLTKSVTVGNVPPKVVVDPDEPDPQKVIPTGPSPTPSFDIERKDGLTVYVDASASRPGDTKGSITSYNYYVGNDPRPAVTIPITSITFYQAGTYKISLHVKDSNENWSATPAQQTVNVQAAQTEPPPTVPLTASFTTGAGAGCTVRVNAFASTPRDQINRYEYTWQKNSSTESDKISTTDPYGNASITLPSSGKYTISLQVFDASGNPSTNDSTQNVEVGASCTSTGETELPIKIAFGNNVPVELNANNQEYISQELPIETKIELHIENTGDVPLTLSEPIINFSPPEVLFTVDKFSENPISIKGKSSVEVTLEASKQITEATLGKATLSFSVTKNEDIFNIKLILKGTVVPQPTPQPEIWLDNQAIKFDNDNSSEDIVFNSTPIGMTETKNFVIQNAEAAELTDLNFMLNNQFDYDYAPKNDSSSFSIILNATKVDNNLGEVFSFKINDVEYKLVLKGEVTPPPQPNACFTVVPDAGFANNAFNLNSECSSEGAGLAWSGGGSFTDNNTQVTQVTFSEGGIHPITLTVTNIAGKTDSMTYYVETPIVETLPVPKFFIEQAGNDITIDPDGGNMQYRLWINGEQNLLLENKSSFNIGILDQPENTIALLVNGKDVAVATGTVANGVVVTNPVANFHIKVENKEVPSHHHSFLGIGAEPLQIKVFSTFEVDASSSFHPSSDSLIVIDSNSYEWFLGFDKTCKKEVDSQNVIINNKNSSLTKLRFTQIAEQYFLCLRVFDNDVRGAVRGKEITVEGYGFPNDDKVHGGVLAKNRFLVKDKSTLESDNHTFKFKNNMFVDIVANVPVQGEKRDAYVVAKLISKDAENNVETWYMKTSTPPPNDWQRLGNSLNEEAIKKLKPYKNLETETNIAIYNGKLPEVGDYEVYVAYLPAGNVVKDHLDAAMQTMAIISFTVAEEVLN